MLSYFNNFLLKRKIVNFDGSDAELDKIINLMTKTDLCPKREYLTIICRMKSQVDVYNFGKAVNLKDYSDTKESIKNLILSGQDVLKK